MQPTLFPFESRLDRQFADFHTANPEVYESIVNLCRKVLAKGRNRWSMKGVWEVMRYMDLRRNGYGNETYKLNNSYPSRYARLVMRQEADLHGFFETRELRS